MLFSKINSFALSALFDLITNVSDILYEYTEKAVRKRPVSQHNIKRGPRTLVLEFYTKLKAMMGERSSKVV